MGPTYKYFFLPHPHITTTPTDILNKKEFIMGGLDFKVAAIVNS